MTETDKRKINFYLIFIGENDNQQGNMQIIQRAKKKQRTEIVLDVL